MEAGPVDLRVRDHTDGDALRTREHCAIELLPLVRVQLLRVVQVGERPNAMVSQRAVVEQDTRHDERSRERSATGLVRARHPAGAEAAVEPKKPLPRPLPRPPARLRPVRRRLVRRLPARRRPQLRLRARARPSGLELCFVVGFGLDVLEILFADCFRGTERGYAASVLLGTDARLLSHFLAQVVELRAVDVTDLDDLDLLDLRRVERERPLDADAEGLLAGGERLARPRALALDHEPFEHLDARPRALDHAEVHLQRVARLELRQVLAQLSLLECLDHLAHREERPARADGQC